MKGARLFIVKSVCLLIFLSGCTSAAIKRSEVPSLGVGSPLISVGPRTFVVRNFTNVTNVKPGVFTDMDSLVGQVTLDDPVEVIVADAIRKELERNGLIGVADGSTPGGDFIIAGTVYKYEFLRNVPMVIGKYSKNEDRGTVAVKLTVSRASDPNTVFIKNYEGEYPYTEGMIEGFQIVVDIMNKALLEMVKKVSMDEELVAFLKK